MNRTNYIPFMLGLIVLLATYLFYYDPTLQEVQRLKIRAQQLERELNLPRTVPDLSNLPALRAQARALRQAVAPTSADPQILLSIQELANALSLDLSTITRLDPVPMPANYEKRTYQVAMKGAPQNAIDFLASVESAPYLIKIDSGSITANNNFVQLTTQISLPVRSPSREKN